MRGRNRGVAVVQWPDRPKDGQWYLRVVPSQSKECNGVTRFDTAFITLHCQGREGTCDFACVLLVRNPSFAWQFDDALKKAINAVQMLNLDRFWSEKQDDPDNICGQCEEPALKDDYLCRKCRSS